jgi:hypothetical protein
MSKIMAAAAAAASVLLYSVGGSAVAHPQRPSPSVFVHGGAGGVVISRHIVAAGAVTFRVDTSNAQSGSIVLLLRPTAHVLRAKLFTDFGEEGSNRHAVAAKGTRDLMRDFRFYGLASVQVGTAATVTEKLHAGKYYLIDGGASVLKFATLWVRAGAGTEGVTDTPSAATVTMSRADRFRAPRILPAHGAVTVRNRGDSIHQMEMVPVKTGTTDADVQAYLESRAFRQGKAAWFDRIGPSVGLPLLSPGRAVQIAWRLPRGTYVLVCRIADDRTGVAHLVMGMHKVVVLK